MAGTLRGAIYWADLDPVRGHEPGGRRPVVVISHQTFNDRAQTAIVMAITSRPQRAGYPVTLPVPPSLLPRPSWVKITQVRTIAVERLGEPLGQLSEAEVRRLVDGLNRFIA